MVQGKFLSSIFRIAANLFDGVDPLEFSPYPFKPWEILTIGYPTVVHIYE
jgi:hypothetical protein